MSEEKTHLSLLRRVHNAIEGFLGYPPIEKLKNKHPAVYKQLHARLATARFTGLPLTLLLLSLGFTLISLFGVAQDYLASDPLIAVDTRIANLLYAFRSPQLLSFFYGTTLFGEAGLVFVVAAVLTGVLWYKRQRLLAIGVWLALVMSEGMTFLGKILFHRERPSFKAIVEDSFSFPSGHATTVAVFYGFIAYLLLRKTMSWKWRAMIIAVLTLLVGLVDLSRLYLGVHFLSDVLAGNFVGLTGVLAAVIFVEWRSSSQSPIDWENLRLAYFIPGAVALMAIVAILFSQAPAFTLQGERPTLKTLTSTDVMSIFTEDGMPKYSETLLGEPQEPVNIILVVPDSCIADNFAKAGWLLADHPSWESISDIALAALKNASYPTAPMTPSFYNSQPHDFGFEKETEERSARERHHARFWDTGYTSLEGEIYVGTASLDVGIKWGITHRIAPDIDTERELLVTGLQQAGVVANVGEVNFVPPVLGSNFSGDPFFTDGTASIITLTDCK